MMIDRDFCHYCYFSNLLVKTIVRWNLLLALVSPLLWAKYNGFGKVIPEKYEFESCNSRFTYIPANS